MNEKLSKKIKNKIAQDNIPKKMTEDEYNKLVKKLDEKEKKDQIIKKPRKAKIKSNVIKLDFETNPDYSELDEVNRLKFQLIVMTYLYTNDIEPWFNIEYDDTEIGKEGKLFKLEIFDKDVQKEIKKVPDWKRQFSLWLQYSMENFVPFIDMLEEAEQAEEDGII
ncbi:MAG: hypothetical protein J7L15_09495 [Clostridiales bacterium]|nr:hypothetical protein [Clostridiales bacterium]